MAATQNPAEKQKSNSENGKGLFMTLPEKENQVFYRLPFRHLKNHAARKLDRWDEVEKILTEAGINSQGALLNLESINGKNSTDGFQVIIPEHLCENSLIVEVVNSKSDIWIRTACPEIRSEKDSPPASHKLDSLLRTNERLTYKYVRRNNDLYVYPHEKGIWVEKFKAYLGIDAGSISINTAFVDQAGTVLETDYTLTEGDVLNNIKKSISRISQFIPVNAEISGTGVTGSGHEIARALVNADLYETELDAHAEAAISMYPDVRYVFDIGGQDSKVLYVNDGMLDDAGMNKKCGAGTGSFLNAQASRLGIPIEDFGPVSMKAGKPYRFSSMCTVFVGRDLIAEQAKGNTRENIIAGLHRSLAMNFFSTLGIDKKRLTPPIIFQGGVAANIGVVAALEDCIEEAQGGRIDIIVPAHHDCMGAIGMAMFAKNSNISVTGFRGLGNVAGVVSKFTECAEHERVNCKRDTVCDVVKLYIDETELETLYACNEYYETTSLQRQEEKSA